ncbi:unnamed protein product [Effrenium voratum]|nr:unnamed protein product [Effrenium voratum]
MKSRATTWQLDAAAVVVMRSGSVKKYFSDKGFGFIAPDEGGDDIFAHSRQFTGGDADSLKEGDRVRFDAEWDDKKGNNKAVTWFLDTGAGMGLAMPMPMAMPGMQAFGGFQSFNNFQPNFGAGQYGPMATPASTPHFSPYGAPGACPQPGFGAPNGAPALPAGWEQITDPSGRLYYCNRGTGETSWTAPAAPAVSPAGALPPGWEQQTDPSSGRSYYCNRATGETSWTPPPAGCAPMSAAPMSAPAPALGAGGGAIGGLPPGWEQTTDPGSGKVYYFNRGTGETRWEPP